MDSKDRMSWAFANGIVATRLKQFIAISRHLVERVNSSLKRSSSGLRRGASHEEMAISNLTLRKLSSPHVLNSLRLIMTWVSDGNILRQKLPRIKTKADLFTAGVPSVNGALTEAHFTNFFPSNVSWRLQRKCKKIYDGRYSTVQ